jgi:hypothetical protein
MTHGVIIPTMVSVGLWIRNCRVQSMFANGHRLMLDATDIDSLPVSQVRHVSRDPQARLLATASDLCRLLRHNLLSILVVPHPRGRGSVPAAFPRANARIVRLGPDSKGKTHRTILPWMAQETQYWSFRYILGTVYSAKTEASEMSPGGGQPANARKATNGWRRTRPCCGW